MASRPRTRSLERPAGRRANAIGLAVDGGDEQVRDGREQRQRDVAPGGELVAQLGERLEGGARPLAVEHRSVQGEAPSTRMRHLVAPARQLLARNLLDEAARSPSSRGNAHPHVQEPVVDAPDLDPELAAPERHLARAEPRHAAHATLRRYDDSPGSLYSPLRRFT